LLEITKQAGDGYCGWARGPVYVPFVAARIAEPPLGHTPVDMLSALPPEVARRYHDLGALLKDGGTSAERYTAHERGHFDSILGSRSEWIKYLRRKECQALWVLRPAGEARATLSVASVAKSTGDALRKILMSIPFNEACVSPEALMDGECDYGLVGAAAIAQLRVADGAFAVRAWDQSNAFSMVTTPACWWPFMAGPTLKVYEADPAWVDPSWPQNMDVRPFYTRLGMGHTHAAWILMCINMNIIESSLRAAFLLEKVRLLNRRAQRATRVALMDGLVAVYLHLDDGSVMAGTVKLAEAVRDVIVAGFESAGFGVTVADPMNGGRYIGFTPWSSPARWTPTPVKLGHLARLFDLLLDTADWVPVDRVHTALSIFVWMALLWRPALSYPQEIFNFTRDHAGRMTWLPREVRRELRWMRGALPFLYADLGRDAAPWVMASDASGPGDAAGDDRFPGAYCVAVGQPARAEVQAVIDGIETVGRRNHMPGPLGGPARQLASLPEVTLLARTVVPREWCSASTPWRSILARRWRTPLEIGRGELRAQVLAARLSAGAGVARRSEVLLLGDNQGSVGTIVRGRSRLKVQNYQMRLLAASEAFGDIRSRAAWISTTRMPADQGTRPDELGVLRLGSISWSRDKKVIVVNDSDDGVCSYLRGAGFQGCQRWSWPSGPGARSRRPGWSRRLIRCIEDELVMMLWWNISSQGSASEPAGADPQTDLYELDVALWAARVAADYGAGWLATVPRELLLQVETALSSAPAQFALTRACFPVITRVFNPSTEKIESHSTHANLLFQSIKTDTDVQCRLKKKLNYAHTNILASPAWLNSNSRQRHTFGNEASAIDDGRKGRLTWSSAPRHVAIHVAGLVRERVGAQPSLARRPAGP